MEREQKMGPSLKPVPKFVVGSNERLIDNERKHKHIKQMMIECTADGADQIKENSLTPRAASCCSEGMRACAINDQRIHAHANNSFLTWMKRPHGYVYI